MIFRRAIALCLVAMFLLLSGCFGTSSNITPTPKEPRTAQPAVTPDATQDAATASRLLKEVDEGLFKEYIGSDALTYHLLLRDPSKYGMDETSAPDSFGELTYAEFERSSGRCQEYLNKLDSINTELLSESELLTYEIIRRYLADELLGADYYYYIEPLEIITGIHVNLPLTMALYSIDSEDDVESYFSLLNDFVRYFGQILDFEREKSERGLFMTTAAAEMVVDHCDTFIASGENCFLITGFDERLDAIEDLSSDKRAEYNGRNKSLVTDSVMQAYKNLRDGIDELKDTGKNEKGLYYAQGGPDYFKYALRTASCGDMKVEDAFNQLKDRIIDQYIVLYDAILRDPDVVDQFGQTSITTGSLESDIAYLKELIANDFPGLPDHEVSFFSAPKELEDQLSPAAYMIPPVDDAFHNTVMINNSSVDPSMSLLSVLAHEAYPGHMYQYVYQRSLEDVGLFPRLISLTAYYEGWSQYAENYLYSNFQSGSDFALFVSANTVIGDVLMPAVVSIGVNAYGWSEQEVKAFLEDYGMTDPSTVAFYYQLAIDAPTYALEYALGYIQFFDILESYRKQKGVRFNIKEFHEEYLNIGPAYFDMVKDRLLD